MLRNTVGVSNFPEKTVTKGVNSDDISVTRGRAGVSFPEKNVT